MRFELKLLQEKKIEQCLASRTTFLTAALGTFAGLGCSLFITTLTNRNSPSSSGIPSPCYTAMLRFSFAMIHEILSMCRRSLSNTKKPQAHLIQRCLYLLAIAFILELSGCRYQEFPQPVHPATLDSFRILGLLQADLGLGHTRQVKISHGYFHELNESAIVRNFVVPPERVPKIIELINSGTTIELNSGEQFFALTAERTPDTVYRY